MDHECNGQLSFLDILVSRFNGNFVTGIFRKKTLTGLGFNFYSYCPFIFKVNSCRTLLFRAYSLCSNWIKFHEEVEFLKQYFKTNCYPSYIFGKVLRKI